MCNRANEHLNKRAITYIHSQHTINSLMLLLICSNDWYGYATVWSRKQHIWNLFRLKMQIFSADVCGKPESVNRKFIYICVYAWFSLPSDSSTHISHIVHMHFIHTSIEVYFLSRRSIKCSTICMRSHFNCLYSFLFEYIAVAETFHFAFASK